MTRVLKIIAQALILGSIAWCGFLVRECTSPEKLSARGGEGEACYPNDTCDQGLTCWALRDERQCELKVAPAVDPGQSCFSIDVGGVPEERCSSKHEECVRAFARWVAANPQGKIERGCSI